jgi:exopolysaccharide biosynthesis WecB/TagA/CpsF family protein
VFHTPAVDILGVPYRPLTTQQAIDSVVMLYERDVPAFVAHANAHTINLATDDPSYREVLQRADLVLNDGKGVMIGARILGKKLPADLNGNHFSPLVLQEAAKRGWKVFFFGAKPGVADRAAEQLSKRFPDLEIVGVRNGYIPEDQMQELVAHIATSGATLLFVGLGNPAQEKWIARHLWPSEVRLAVGVGAFFDFQAGEIERAPKWMNRMGLEWVFRLLKEPKRMWKRYIYGNPRFLWNVLKQRFRGPKPSPH